MKLAIYTSALEGWISGGIACIIEVLNSLHATGHDVCAFVDINGDKNCTWIKNNFPIYPADSEEYRNYDGILVSPFSVTAKAVADHQNAKDRFYWVHTNEAVFNDNDVQWRKRASDSYSLPLKIFCTSSYVQIIMEQIYNRNTIGRLVSPGFDNSIFRSGDKSRFNDKNPLRVVMWGRGGWVRGIDVALEGLSMAKDLGVPIQVDVLQDGIKSRLAVAERYKRAHVYLDASRLAGCPTPVIESMACGTVPICTRYGTTDFVLNDYNGFIVPSDAPGKIAIALKRAALESLDLGIYSENAVGQVKDRNWDAIAYNFDIAIAEGLSRADLLEKRF